jgi:hypothetical protein
MTFRGQDFKKKYTIFEGTLFDPLTLSHYMYQTNLLISNKLTCHIAIWERTVKDSSAVVGPRDV